MRLIRILLALVCILALTGCPPPIEELDITSPKVQQSVHGIREHARISEQMTFARFLQMTVRSKDWNKTFSSELYQRSDSTIIYSGGFLGKGAFKGLVTEDSLTLLFLSKKQFYRGNAGGLIEPDLSEYRYVMKRTLDVFSGRLLCDSTELTEWKQRIFVVGRNVEVVTFESKEHPLYIKAELESHSNEFPYYRIGRIEIKNLETNARIRANVVEDLVGEGMNLGEKFTLPDYSSWQQVASVALH